MGRQEKADLTVYTNLQAISTQQQIPNHGSFARHTAFFFFFFFALHTLGLAQIHAINMAYN